LAAPNGVRVQEAVVADPELLEAMQSLLPELSSSAAPLNAYMLDDIVDSRSTALFIARDADDKIVGSLTLAIFRVPTGVRAWIEDVVVNDGARGAGVGSALVEAAVARANEAGARTVDLTSRPDREAANRLYQRLGFEQRATNVYRRTLGPAADPHR